MTSSGGGDSISTGAGSSSTRGMAVNLSSTGVALMEGVLSKWTNVMKGWQFRWFVLDENTGLLSYYTVYIQILNANFPLIYLLIPERTGCNWCVCI